LLTMESLHKMASLYLKTGDKDKIKDIREKLIHLRSSVSRESGDWTNSSIEALLEWLKSYTQSIRNNNAFNCK
ncbi:MAG: hypothetical protein J6X34_07375, partial [Clostridia bacterium]|nr:hypothetical protein [Clostridia bacterium]